jgi:hypothetical protein
MTEFGSMEGELADEQPCAYHKHYLNRGAGAYFLMQRVKLSFDLATASCVDPTKTQKLAVLLEFSYDFELEQNALGLNDSHSCEQKRMRP